MTISVSYLPSYDEVTVRTGYFEGGEFIEESCNHAGAESVEVDCGRLRNYPNFDWEDDWRWVMVCDKCGKVLDEDGIWE